MTELGAALVATRWGVFLLRTILSFWKRRAVRYIESSQKLLNIKEVGMDYFKTTNDLPVVEFTIVVEKKAYLKLQLQKLLLELTCDHIPLKTFFWDRNYNIEGLKDSPDIEALDIDAIGDGYIVIRYPCVNVFYRHDPIHKWELMGKITYHSKIGDITKEKTLRFQLGDEKDKKKEEKLKKAIADFQNNYIERGGKYPPVS